MKKLLCLLIVLCLMGCMSVSATNISLTEDIGLYETKLVKVPEPEGEIDGGVVYFTQEFTFIPKESGTYQLLMSYQEDKDNPYCFTLDKAGTYREIEGGIEFDATAGEACQLSFQYPTHDGRYPEVTFFLGTPGTESIPQTADPQFLLPLVCLILSATLLVTVKKQYHV